MSITVCITVYNRYDLLANLRRSLEASTIRPNVLVCDMGQQPAQLADAMGSMPYGMSDYRGRCLATSWNWFIAHTDEDRIIVCEDFELAPDSIAKMVLTPGPFVGTLRADYCFGCFIIRQACIEQVGLFDEALSPNYVYFEDSDYMYRMKLAGVPIAVVDGVTHVGQGTLVAYSPEEMADHHRKFLIAQANYIAKWGGMPFHETFTTPHDYQSR